MSNAELACTYAALILHDGEVEISAEKIQALLTAANVKADAYTHTLTHSPDNARTSAFFLFTFFLSHPIPTRLFLSSLCFLLYSYWAGLFAKLAASTNIGDLLSAVGSAAPV